MNRKRKVVLGLLTTFAIVVTPITLVVSCSRYGIGDAFFVADGGSINDKSFNQQGAMATAGILNKNQLAPSDYYEPKKSDAATIEQGFAAALNANKKIIIGTGFHHETAIQKWVKMQGNVLKFIIADVSGAKPEFKNNVAGIQYRTKESGFLAGYLASEYLTKVKYDTNPTVGTFGGGNFPAVTDFMVGFVMGVKYYNENQKPTNLIKFAGFAQAADYTNSGFSSGGGITKASVLSKNGADVILPVAGPQSADVLSVIRNQDKYIIGVDTDQKTKFSISDSHKFLTSITKNIQESIIAVYKKVTNKKVESWVRGYGETTIGDLANGMTGIAKPGTQDALKVYETINNNKLLKQKASSLVDKVNWIQALEYINKNKR